MKKWYLFCFSVGCLVGVILYFFFPKDWTAPTGYEPTTRVTVQDPHGCTRTYINEVLKNTVCNK